MSDHAEVVVNVLGVFEARTAGEEMALGGRLPRLVLARVLAAGEAGVTADEIIDDVWGGRGVDLASGTLHAYVSRLRRLLGHAALRRDGRGYVLDRSLVAIDADRFADEVARGRQALHRGRDADAVDVLRSALARWRGPHAFGTLVDTPFLVPEAARLAQLRVGAAELLADALARRGARPGRDDEPDQEIRLLEELAALDPMREPLAIRLVRALDAAGRQADALAAYERCRRALAEELGVDPTPALRAAHAAVLAQRAARDRRCSPTCPRATARSSGGPRCWRRSTTPSTTTAAVPGRWCSPGSRAPARPRWPSSWPTGGAGRARSRGGWRRRTRPAPRRAWPTWPRRWACRRARGSRTRSPSWAGRSTAPPDGCWSSTTPTTRSSSRPSCRPRRTATSSSPRATRPGGASRSRWSSRSWTGGSPSPTSPGAAATRTRRRRTRWPSWSATCRWPSSTPAPTSSRPARRWPTTCACSAASTPPCCCAARSPGPGASPSTACGGRSPLAAALLETIAFLSADAIGIDLIAPLAPDELSLHDAVAVLLRLSLVDRQADTLRVHRLVQDVVRARLPEPALRSRLADAAALCVADHAGGGRSRAAHLLVLAQHSAALGWVAPGLVAALADAARQFADRAVYPAAEQVLRQALRLVDGSAPGDRVERGALTCQLGEVLDAAGRLDEALPLHVEAVALLTAGDAEPAIVAHAHNRLGHVLNCADRSVEAIDAQETAVAVLRAAAREDVLAPVLIDMGYTLWAVGRLDDARAAFDAGLALLTRFGRRAGRDGAHATGGLGMVAQDEGDLDRAVACHRAAIEQFTQVCGAEHPDTAQAYDKLGYTLRLQGQVDASVVAHRRAWRLLERLLGPDDSRVAMTLSNLGLAYAESDAPGAVADAVAAQERAHAIFLATLGPGHASTAMAARRRDAAAGTLDAVNVAAR